VLQINRDQKDQHTYTIQEIRLLSPKEMYFST